MFSETMEDEPTQLHFELLAEAGLDTCEAVPGIEEKSSNIFEEKTNILFTEEFPNLVKMFPVRTFENSVCEETTLKAQTKLEENIQSWVDASVIKKHGDSDSERPSRSQRCKIAYCNELKTDADEIKSTQDTSTKEENSMQPITVKFLINEISAFTCAFEIHTYMKEVKQTLSRTFQCQPADLQLIRNGVVLSDTLEISELGVEPYGTVEIEIKAKGSLKTENMYDVPIVPDVITVRVESGMRIFCLHIRNTSLKHVMLYHLNDSKV
jgi:hypothetical protein